jgi:hypothetical protein
MAIEDNPFYEEALAKARASKPELAHTQDINAEARANEGVPSSAVEEGNAPQQDFRRQEIVNQNNEARGYMPSGEQANAVGQATTAITPDLERARLQNEMAKSNLQSEQNIANAMGTGHASALTQHQQDLAAHKAQQDVLQDNLQNAHDVHAQNKIDLANARLHDVYAKIRGPEDFLPPDFFKYTPPPAPQMPQMAAPSQAAQPTPKPLGGTGTQQYAQKFGATGLEALNTPSMSAFQKDIPGIASSLQKIQSIAPNVASYEESPLLIAGPEGQAYVQRKSQALADAEEATRQMKAAHEAMVEQHKQAVEDERLRREQMLKDANKQVAQSKFMAASELKDAEDAHAKSEKSIRDATKDLNEHISKTPLPPQPVSPVEEERQRAKVESAKMDVKANPGPSFFTSFLERGLRGMTGASGVYDVVSAINNMRERGVNTNDILKSIEGGTLVGAAANPRTAPAAGVAGLVNAGHNIYENGPTAENLTHGLSSLGLIASPYAPKTGALMQVPSLGLAGYNYIQEHPELREQLSKNAQFLGP